jgi:hypothetical protein
MRLALAAAVLALSGAIAWAQPADAPAPNRIDKLRQDLRTDKRGVVERNMQLTAEEAAKFWPIYDEYQRDIDRIAQRQNRAIIDYINTEHAMTDENAKRIEREILKADAAEQDLRERVLRKLLRALPARKAVRYMQIENKIRILQRYDIAERISLVQ